MKKELDESFEGKIVYKSPYGSIEHYVNSTNISTALTLAEALIDCGYIILEIHFLKAEKKNGEI